jgi:hypothetical protein
MMGVDLAKAPVEISDPVGLDVAPRLDPRDTPNAPARCHHRQLANRDGSPGAKDGLRQLPRRPTEGKCAGAKHAAAWRM